MTAMDLGTFSISLTVNDLAASRSFYESVGFTVFDGDEESWVMMRNGDAKIGLFHGMFESNMITLNPPDARAVESALATAGYQPVSSTQGESGPTNFVMVDPDGNVVLFDQHGD